MEVRTRLLIHAIERAGPPKHHNEYRRIIVSQFFFDELMPGDLTDPDKSFDYIVTLRAELFRQGHKEWLEWMITVVDPA